MTTLARRFDPSESHLSVKMVALSEQLTGKVRPALLLLLGAVGLALLIACANVANMKLAGGPARGRGIASRAAPGAGPRGASRASGGDRRADAICDSGRGRMAAGALAPQPDHGLQPRRLAPRA